MRTVAVLTKRNTKLFLRDRATVFFSLMSSMILIALYFLFIAKTYMEGMRALEGGALFAQSGRNSAYFLIYLQMMAGVLVLNSMSLSTGAFSTIARDFENGRIDCFLLSPVKRHQWIASYLMTGLLVSFCINLLTWALTYCVIGLQTGFWLGADTFFRTVFALLVASLLSCSLMLLFTAVVRSSAAVGVFNGIAGTFFGFLCGIYMPLSAQGSGVKLVGSALPFTHLTIWMKQILLQDAFFRLSVPQPLAEILARDFFSAEEVGFLGLPAPLWLTVSGSLLLGVACFFAACVLLKKRSAGKTRRATDR